MDQEKRTKPRQLTPTVKRFIFEEAIRQRNVPRDLLAHRLIKEIDETPEISPALETAKRYISKARNTTNPIDKPWTLGACRDYPTFFPPSSLLRLMKMQEDHKKFADLMTNATSPGLSIRICMWVVRLEPLIKEYFMHGQEDFQQESDILFNVANAYSAAERTSEIMGEQAFDTTDLDQSVCSQNLENIFILASGFRNTTSICKGDCDSCKYVPIFPGKLCQLKTIHQEDETLEKQIIEERPTQTNEKGD